LGKLLCQLFRLDASLLREGARPADRPKDTSLDCRRTTELLGWAPRSLVQLAQRAGALSPAHA
jgi:dTDP-4-dehydrorhamnose reductase